MEATAPLGAKVIKPFKGVRDGEIYPVQFAIGDTVEGKLANTAVANGWAAREVMGTSQPEEPKKAPRRGRKS